MAAESHPFPSRTRPLSPPAPMVLGGRPPGRVGRRRISRKKRPRFAGGALVVRSRGSCPLGRRLWPRSGSVRTGPRSEPARGWWRSPASAEGPSSASVAPAPHGGGGAAEAATGRQARRTPLVDGRAATPPPIGRRPAGRPRDHRRPGRATSDRSGSTVGAAASVGGAGQPPLQTGRGRPARLVRRGGRPAVPARSGRSATGPGGRADRRRLVRRAGGPSAGGPVGRPWPAAETSPRPPGLTGVDRRAGPHGPAAGAPRARRRGPRPLEAPDRREVPLWIDEGSVRDEAVRATRRPRGGPQPARDRGGAACRPTWSRSWSGSAGRTRAARSSSAGWRDAGPRSRPSATATRRRS